MINRRIENIEDDELTRVLNMVFEVNILRQIQMKSQTGYIKAPNKFYFSSMHYHQCIYGNNINLMVQNTLPW